MFKSHSPTLEAFSNIIELCERGGGVLDIEIELFIVFCGEV